MLNAAGIRTLSRGNSSVVFRSGISRTVSPSWNILAPLDSGKIELNDDGVDIAVAYRASTTQLLIWVSLIACRVTLFISYQNDLPVTDYKWAFMFVWFWLGMFGGNYIVSAIQFPRWLRRGLERSNGQA